MSRNQSLLILAVTLVIAWFCYSAAFTSAYQLDDEVNLGGLVKVSDSKTFADFVMSGTAGPTGRPLSLLTFAWQADEWQHGPRAFLQFSTLLHLLNAILLAFCVRAVFLMRGLEDRVATLVAVVSASLWVVLPLIATATLLVVQRMTGLSAMFVLLGLAGYLAARMTIARSPRRALLLMGASLAAGTLLAVLAKESGILLPLFVLVLELTLLSRPNVANVREWRIAQALFVWFPVALIVVILFAQLPYDDSMVLRRDFNAWERVLTEAGILWTYLFKAVAGIPGRLGIYQSEPTIVRSLLEPMTLLAVLAWVSALAAAIRWRRALPLLSFAVLWFLAGHVLESTVLPLELYFEHRNYLPIAGPVVALVAFLLLHSAETQRLSRLILPVIFVLNAGLLYGVTSLQGDPSVSARFWAQKYPDSIRAVLNFGRVQLIEEGVEPAVVTVNTFANSNPEHGYLRIYVLDAACQNFADRISASDVQAIADSADGFAFSFMSAQMLSALHTTTTRTSCNAVPVSAVVALADAIRANPRYAANAEYNKLHFMLMAVIARTNGNLDAAIEHIKRALDYQMTPQIVQILAITYVEMNDYDAARDVAQNASNNIPLNPFRAWQWRRSIAQIYDLVDAAERRDLLTK